MWIAELIEYLRTALKLPPKQIQSYLATLHKLLISVGEMVALTHAA